MPNKIDRSAKYLELADDPIDVTLLGGAEAFWKGNTKARKSESHSINIAQMGSNVVPKMVSISNSMYKNSWHVSPSRAETFIFEIKTDL
jgi:hypothetical protein